MINSDTQIDEALLLRYFEGEVTLSEKEEIEKWIISSEANKKHSIKNESRFIIFLLPQKQWIP
jgi:hypothetical protein